MFHVKSEIEKEKKTVLNNEIKINGNVLLSRIQEK